MWTIHELKTWSKSGKFQNLSDELNHEFVFIWMNEKIDGYINVSCDGNNPIPHIIIKWQF